MNVSLTHELDQYVAEKVASGRYTSASEVVREALRLMEERDQSREAQLVAFQQQLDERLQSLDQGKYADPAAVRRRIEQKSKAQKSKLRKALDQKPKDQKRRSA